MSTYRSAGKGRETSQFLQKPQKLSSVTTCCYIVSIRRGGAVQRNVFFLLCDIIQGSGPFDKAGKLERRIHVGDEREDKEQFTSTPTRRLIMSQHNGSREENTNLLTPSINSAVFNLSSVPTTVMIYNNNLSDLRHSVYLMTNCSGANIQILYVKVAIPSTSFKIKK